MLRFLINSIFLGVGLAMDAFSVCIVNGLNETGMKGSRKYKMAVVFALFQTAMPVLGWICVKTVEELFTGFQKLIPWIAFFLLLFIGAKMIYEAVRKKKDEDSEIIISDRQLFVQGVATSIDALSVGFAISAYSFGGAFGASAIIGAVTFIICLAGLKIGRIAGERFSDKATILGGVILICIGIEILVL